MATIKHHGRPTMVEADGTTDDSPSAGPKRQHGPSAAAVQPKPPASSTVSRRRALEQERAVVRSRICASLFNPAVWPILEALGTAARPPAELRAAAGPGGRAALVVLFDAGLITDPAGEVVAFTPLGRECWTGSLRLLYR